MMSQRLSGWSGSRAGVVGCGIGILALCLELPRLPAQPPPAEAAILDFKDDGQFAAHPRQRPDEDRAGGREPTRASGPPRSCLRRCRKGSATTRPWSSRIRRSRSATSAPSRPSACGSRIPGRTTPSCRCRSGTRTAIAPSPFPRRSRSSRAAGSRSWPGWCCTASTRSKSARSTSIRRSNRRPVTLLIADVQLLSPYAGRLAGQIQATRQALNVARSNALALGAKDQVEPKIAALARGLDQLENTAAAVNTAASSGRSACWNSPGSRRRLRSLSTRSRSSTAARRIVLSGPARRGRLAEQSG